MSTCADACASGHDKHYHLRRLLLQLPVLLRITVSIKKQRTLRPRTTLIVILELDVQLPHSDR